ncbi:DUF2922 domain-containing protein [Metabacillus idriensis]|uniref:DUF2922 family protein n=1 Tax=Metabacillus idriensis TaxID=324768 RepID=A0A6I2MC26_9BACI|nr:DUF2922 domain-containing protein [Metabacillus idriensis]MCM3594642.1 DUF2922 domain-containing protein [Metabacillus idriensis]MRX53333.1 DUF2922 family protein [Metabacillus idriensis]OHR67233.1 hypothetical protein HMPREF3291_10980 [Bacillus sp. HMSC76G11]
MAKTLELQFLNEEGKQVKINIDSPKEPVVESDVSNAMDLILVSNTFTSPGGDLISKKGARVVERNLTDLTIG